MPFETVGYEVIHDYLLHILGDKGRVSGVPMHLGHFSEAFRQQSGSVVTNNVLRTLIQSGVACWLKSMPTNVIGPCCDLMYIGGDGTFIGIPTTNVTNVSPVWEPYAGIRAPTVSWSRVDRMATKTTSPTAWNGIVQFIAVATDLSTLESTRTMMIKTSSTLELPPVLLLELRRWLALSFVAPEWKPLRLVFRCLFSQASLTTAFTKGISNFIIESSKDLLVHSTSRSAISLIASHHSFLCEGLGPEISAVLCFQVQSTGVAATSTMSALIYLGEST